MPESNNMAKLVRSVLGSPTSELVMKRQVIDLARKNLHLTEVLVSLLESLPLVPDTETRNELLGLLMNLNTSRFENLDALHQAFMGIFKSEKDRALRVAILQRLEQGLRQDERLAPFMLELFSELVLNEEERSAVLKIIAGLPSITPQMALTALERCKNSPASIQVSALSIAERCPQWDSSMIAAISPYLNIKVEQGIRLRILRKLADAKSLTSDFFPLLRQILQNDPDAQARGMALSTLHFIKPWNEVLLEQLLWTATKDADASLRSRATSMQQEAPELSPGQLARLAAQLASDHNSGVRVAVLEILKKYMRLPEIRQAIVTAFSSNPSVFSDEEFAKLLELLSPYAGREEVVRNALLSSLKALPQAAKRRNLLELLLPKVRVEQVVGIMVELFSREHDEALRETLFTQLKPLSVAKHPELVKAFCAELVEPSSVYRLACATALASAAEIHADIPPALEDVLLNDTERDLVRACLDGYLKPKVEKRFEPMLAVIQNELVDAVSRQKCLDELLKLPLSENEQQRLNNTLAGIKPNTLRMPS